MPSRNRDMRRLKEDPGSFFPSDGWYEAAFMGRTPDALEAMGCTNGLMFATPMHLESIMRPKSFWDDHAHGLSEDDIRAALSCLGHPAAVMRSIHPSPDGRDIIVAMTSALDRDGLPIVAAIDANGVARYEAEKLDSTFICSIYGRKNPAGYLDRALSAGKLMYCDRGEMARMGGALAERCIDVLEDVPDGRIFDRVEAVPHVSRRGRFGGAVGPVGETMLRVGMPDLPIYATIPPHAGVGLIDYLDYEPTAVMRSVEGDQAKCMWETRRGTVVAMIDPDATVRRWDGSPVHAAELRYIGWMGADIGTALESAAADGRLLALDDRIISTVDFAAEARERRWQRAMEAAALEAKRYDDYGNLGGSDDGEKSEPTR